MNNANNDRKLNVMFWNCQGIKGKIMDFYNLITCSNIDIVCLNETFLKPKDNIQVLHSDHLLRLDKIGKRLGGLIKTLNLKNL